MLESPRDGQLGARDGIVVSGFRYSTGDVIDDDQADLPYGENFHDEAEASAWADAAIKKRPWRPMIFDMFVAAVAESAVAAPRILELGSGPGFLAAHVLDRCPSIARYTLLDFAKPMLSLSERRLGSHVARTSFVQADFKSDSWPSNLAGPFDFVFSMQAVHELRHKRHAPRLYERIRALLSPGAEIAICDHLPEIAPTPRQRQLYMSTSENLAAITNAGFSNAKLVWSDHHMAMYRAGV
jgi:SAM-dependent methyltransferase